MRPYLNDSEIEDLPLGFEYKKKSIGGSIIFKKKSFAFDKKSIMLELYSKNGVWAINDENLQKVYDFFGLYFQPVYQSLNQVSGKTTNGEKSINVNGRADLSSVKPMAHWGELSSIAFHRAKFDGLIKWTGWNGFQADTHDYSIIIPDRKKDLDEKKYVELYQDYSDPEELHYFDSDSPEYMRLNNLLAEVSMGKSVLDIGCNSGFLSLKMKEKGCLVYGVDINPLLLKKAKSRGIKTFEAFAEKLPFDDEMFDIVSICYVLEHVLDPNKALKEAYRVLKLSGKIIGSVPTEIGDWGKHNYLIHSEHLRCYTEKTLEKTLKKVGFINIKIKREYYVGRNVADSYFFTGGK